MDINMIRQREGDSCILLEDRFLDNKCASQLRVDSNRSYIHANSIIPVPEILLQVMPNVNPFKNQNRTPGNIHTSQLAPRYSTLEATISSFLGVITGHEATC